jgi:SAM-dependent methyltransferase
MAQATETKESVRFDRAAGTYDATRGHAPEVSARIAQAFAEAGALGDRSRVLEVGIGTGRIALPLSHHVGRVVGVDLSRPMLEVLRSKDGRGALRAAVADATRLPFADASFDAAVAVHVFHLIPGWREVAAEVARVLRPGAPLLLAGDGPRMPGLWEEWRQRFGGEAEENVGVPRSQIQSFLGGLGWREQGGQRRVSFPFSLTPRDAIAMIEARTWSSLWRLDDEKLAGLAKVARELLTREYGDLDRRVDVDSYFWIQPWVMPAAGDASPKRT